MEVLDKVYNAFKNLDRDYARSKKTRSEFIRDKFGGDIKIGSLIILDAISSSTGDETPEDIDKLTFIKEIFAKIQEVEDNLDAMPDFTFTSTNLYTDFLKIMNRSYILGTGQQRVSQQILYTGKPSAMHVLAAPKGTQFCRMDEAKVVNVYSVNIGGVLSDMTRGTKTIEVGKCYGIAGGTRTEALSVAEINKRLKPKRKPNG